MKAPAKDKKDVNDQFLHAALRGNIKAAEQLLRTGADPNARNEDGKTALNLACYYGYAAIAQLMLQHGADVNAADKDGWTPLHEACYHALVDTVYFLLQHGAQPGIKATDGQTALDITVALTRSSERREEILTVFQQFAPEFYFSHFCTSAMAPGGI
jgi:ankyrin repeat protein